MTRTTNWAHHGLGVSVPCYLVLGLQEGVALTMRARLGTPRKTLLKDAEEAADLLLLPRV